VSLTEFGKYSTSKNLDLLGRLQRKLYNYGRWVFFWWSSFFDLYLINAILSLHAGVSTTEHKKRQAISSAAFVDAVKEYEEDSETDDEGDMREA
jgi:hypothetical protein